MTTQDTDNKLKNAYSSISEKWDNDIIPQIETFITIPNKSVVFDPDWKKNGYMDEAMTLITNWCEKQNIKGMTLRKLELSGRTPLLYLEIEGSIDETILLYGHMDKQPEMEGWDADKGPWKPVMQDGKLYGRGGADDGYAVFASLTAIKTLQDLNIPHARCVVLIEASEESGSCDLPYYLEELKQDIGSPNLVICLDSGCGNYTQLWSTTSLRGVIDGKLSINVLDHGLHSGVGSGVVPSAFNVLTELLARVQDAHTNEVLPAPFVVDIPDQRIAQAKKAAEQLGDEIVNAYPLAGNTQPLNSDDAELLLNRTWRAALSIIGADGIPATATGGNVTLPSLCVNISIRIPPTADAQTCIVALKEILEANPPHGANVEFTPGHADSGWNAPTLSPWLEKANSRASDIFYEKPAAYMGEGGSIPFMGMLGDMYPDAQFLIAGVLGPKSNAHGPNEFLHIDMGKRITGCVASVIASHYEEFS